MGLTGDQVRLVSRAVIVKCAPSEGKTLNELLAQESVSTIHFIYTRTRENIFKTIVSRDARSLMDYCADNQFPALAQGKIQCSSFPIPHFNISIDSQNPKRHERVALLTALRRVLSAAAPARAQTGSRREFIKNHQLPITFPQPCTESPCGST